MIETLVWLLFLELTTVLILGGYVLYEIQTALAIIVLHECSKPDGETVDPPRVLTPEIVTGDVSPLATHDETETTGTFTGAAWR